MAFQYHPSAEETLGLSKPPLVDPALELRRLKPAHGIVEQLTPESDVIVMNRGRTTLHDQFDGTDFPIEPGLTVMPYGPALHFQRRLNVPGSRDPLTGKQESFLAIICPVFDRTRQIDKADRCVPFTDDQVAKYGLAVEAIDRSVILGAGGKAQLLETRQVLAGMIGRDVRREVDALPPEDVLAPLPPDQNIAVQAGHLPRSADLADDAEPPRPAPRRGR